MERQLSLVPESGRVAAITEWLSIVGDYNTPFRITKAHGSIQDRFYFIYWDDGLIQRRDTYLCHSNGGATLFHCHKRYGRGMKWIEES